MKKTLLIITLFIGLGNLNAQSNNNLNFSELYFYYDKKPDVPMEIVTKNSVFDITQDSKNDDIVVIKILSEKHSENGKFPMCIVELMFSKDQLTESFPIIIPITDDWTKKGLDTQNSSIVKFNTLSKYGQGQYDGQASSNWGGHVIGNSEGNIVITKYPNNKIAGYFNVTVYYDGSAMDSSLRTVIEKSFFEADLLNK
tara:strand:- start:1485 stop:2078 length:594 start_codon:yes stop_codon:yes gene_type:complete